MPLPIIILGGVVTAAYLLGRFFKKDREKQLEDQLDLSESMRHVEKKKTREEIIEELRKE